VLVVGAGVHDCQSHAYKGPKATFNHSLETSTLCQTRDPARALAGKRVMQRVTEPLTNQFQTFQGWMRRGAGCKKKEGISMDYGFDQNSGLDGFTSDLRKNWERLGLCSFPG
jgi:hypothetical protein